MPKNIVVCSDGTGNSGILNRGTNVFKIFEALDLNSHQTNPQAVRQVAIYDDGVGSQDFLPLKLLGGAFGWGLSKNIRRLYLEIARVYEPGDRLYFFGFSRGAFTVRMLAGLIADMGLLDLHQQQFSDSGHMGRSVERLYDMHRRKYPSLLQKLWGRVASDAAALTFRNKNCVPGDISIEFLGVWDTVNAVGVPFEEGRWLLNKLFFCVTFPDQRVLDNVQHAYHALSIDDERQTFHPTMWEPDPKVEQVWFPGVHANVGGGYPKQGISLVALDWMMSKAEAHQLYFVPEVRRLYRALQSESDKLYDSRSGAAVYYRFAPRDISQLSRFRGCP